MIPEDVGKLFNAINNSMPVSNIYTDEKAKEQKELVERLVDYLIIEFPIRMKKKTKSAKLPNICVNELMEVAADKLLKLKKEKLITGESKDLLSKIDDLNDKLNEILHEPDGFGFSKDFNKAIETIKVVDFKKGLKTVMENLKPGKKACYLGFFLNCSWLTLIGKKI